MQAPDPPCLVPTHIGHATPEGFSGEDAWAVHRAAVILGAPAGTVDVDVLWLQAQRLGLNHVGDGAIQHAHTCMGGSCSLAGHPACAPCSPCLGVKASTTGGGAVLRTPRSLPCPRWPLEYCPNASLSSGSLSEFLPAATVFPTSKFPH